MNLNLGTGLHQWLSTGLHQPLPSHSWQLARLSPGLPHLPQLDWLVLGEGPQLLRYRLRNHLKKVPPWGQIFNRDIKSYPISLSCMKSTSLLLTPWIGINKWMNWHINIKETAYTMTICSTESMDLSSPGGNGPIVIHPTSLILKEWAHKR